MRFRIASLLTMSALLIASAFSLGGSASASASRSPQLAQRGNGVAPSQVTKKKVKKFCDNSKDVVTDSIVSQTFEASLAAFDTQGASDCLIKKKASVKGIIAYGVYFNGAGLANSEDVTIYSDNGFGIPGGVFNAQLGLLGGDNGTGTFTIDAAHGYLPVALPGPNKTYWFSVVANMAFAAGGEWGWDAGAVLHNNPDQWQNPGGGFAMCPTWCPLNTLDGTSIDFLKTILGKAK